MIPRVRSESPAFDMRHPTVAAVELVHNEAARGGRLTDAPDMESREEPLRDRGDVVDEDVTTDDG
jgi:cytochrome c oxidase subunit 1